MNILHVKSIKPTHILFVRCSFCDFYRFKLALPSLLFLSKDDHYTLGNVSIPKLLEHFAGDERFLLAFPSSLLSGYALNNQTGHGRGRDLDTRSVFSLPRVVRSINVQYLLHPRRDTSP